ncbi:alpha-hydroxy acid oxidase [Pararobbsia silviterrae]|uniref:Alpha-hydroxy-acid oxidizing protein n=1 Tax=Pararobbsia silviterrae TaxID=1792498 RepID=A0A494XZ35_9BURK|nr:alpha-hydroxy acid oxidase [Pararobbsia silviterrae]RKP55777.1 alpha-hydroxy-acid oxidizing protein [Pararobbsia silviterrae]
MKRSLYAGRDFRRTRNIDELRLVAKRWLPNFVFEYVDSGAEDEVTLRENRSVFDAWRFVPSALVDATARDTSISLLGQRAAYPLVIAPTGYNGMQRRDADISLARAAAQRNIPFTLSTVSNCTIEDVVAGGQARTWMQLYMLRERAVTRNLLDRARDAGCDTLVLTVDAVYYGNREWDRRSYVRDMQLNWRNKLDVLRHPRWIANVLVPHGVPAFANIARYLPEGERRASNGAVYIAKQMETALDWSSVRWLREHWQGKLVIKGILNVADALEAVRLGADGIVVTNHGGRQLDSTVTSLDVLPEIAAACRGRLTVIVDGGFRRGTEIVKALCLGADAVMLGRATLYGVAAGGFEGAAHALTLLTSEIERTLGHLGCRSVADLSPNYLRPAHAGLRA